MKTAFGKWPVSYDPVTGAATANTTEGYGFPADATGPVGALPPRWGGACSGAALLALGCCVQRGASRACMHAAPPPPRSARSDVGGLGDVSASAPGAATTAGEATPEEVREELKEELTVGGRCTGARWEAAGPGQCRHPGRGHPPQEFFQERNAAGGGGGGGGAAAPGST